MLSTFVGATVNTGVGENSHLSSLRNALGGNVGVSLVVFLVLLPKVPLLFLVKESQVGKDHSPLIKIVLLFSLSIPISIPISLVIHVVYISLMSILPLGSL